MPEPTDAYVMSGDGPDDAATTASSGSPQNFLADLDEPVYDLVEQKPGLLTRWRNRRNDHMSVICNGECGAKDCRYQPAVINEVAAERERQISKGYDTAHDQQHGLLHLTAFIMDRLLGVAGDDVEVPDARQRLIEIAALAVAAVEWIDG